MGKGAGSRVRLTRIAIGVIAGLAVLGILCPGLSQVYLSRTARAVPGRAAPAIESGAWINALPLRPADLHGKVVLVEFWTFG